MNDSLSARLARSLAAAGADTMFGLPGGGPNLDVVGAANGAGLRFVLAHGETAAAIMASTYGRLTGQPTPVVVTRGPGAASVINGAAQATLDRFPLVVVADTVPSSSAPRVPHQRIDQRSLFEPVTKRSATVADLSDDADLADLLDVATAWPAGAVHLDFDPAHEQPTQVVSDPPLAVVDEARLDQARQRIAAASRPIVIVGFEAAQWGSAVAPTLETFGCPVLTTYQALGVVPTEGPLNAGLFTNGALERPVLESADLVVALGLDEVEPIPARWDVEAPVVRLSTVAQESPYLPLAVDVVAPIDDLLATLQRGDVAWQAEAAAEFRTDARSVLRPPDAEAFGPTELVEVAAAARPAGLTTTVDAGAHFLAVMPKWPVEEPMRLLISNGLATMGFALPAAIGAALARPNQPVLALTGDGGLSMVLAELETVARLDLPITTVVFNDSALSLIEIKQQANHGGAEAVRYEPVDFATVATASGVPGTVVYSANELAAVLADGWDRPRLIDARIDPGAYPHLIKATRG